MGAKVWKFAFLNKKLMQDKCFPLHKEKRNDVTKLKYKNGYKENFRVQKISVNFQKKAILVWYCYTFSKIAIARSLWVEKASYAFALTFSINFGKNWSHSNFHSSFVL